MTPITLRLNFSLVGKPIPSFGNLQPILAVDAQRYFVASVSPGTGIFQKGVEGVGVDSRTWGKRHFAFPFSFPLRRIVELTMSVRMTLASPLTSQGELPLLRPALVPQPLFLNLELLLWLSLTFLPCAQKQTTCTPFLPYFLTLCFIPRPFLAPVSELSPALYPNN